MPPLRRGRSAARDAAIADRLECPLCMELPNAEVHQCSNGHVFCSDCLGMHRKQQYAGSSKCPTCRVALGDEPIRNREAEKRIGLLAGACDGCAAGMLRKDLQEHMAMCGDVKVECPFPGCSVHVARRDLAAHMSAASDTHLELAQAHHKRLLAAESTLATLTVPVCIFLYTGFSPGPSGAWEGRPYHFDEVELKVMEPIREQDDFVEYLAEHGIDLAAATVSVDPSKTPFELGVDNLTHIRIPGDAVTLKVVTQAGDEIYFKCKQDTKLEKLMAAFCNRQGLSLPRVRFLFDGQRIRPEDTPRMLEMEDGDVIDAILEDPH